MNKNASHIPSHEGLAILDFGSQYSQLIARRVREGGVFSELFYWNTPADEVMAHHPKGFILSGGPESVYAKGAPHLPRYILDSGLPVLGICYGMGLLAHYLGGQVAPATEREYGLAEIELGDLSTPLLPLAQLPKKMQVWMSHGDRIEQLAPDFYPLASSDNSPNAAMGNPNRGLYGVQFHPEVVHTPYGAQILRNFAVEVCQCRPDWTAGNFIKNAIATIQDQVGDSSMVLGLSGGVDSSVVAALAHQALGDRLVCIFVDTGMMRLGEPEQVVSTFSKEMNVKLIAVNAVEEYLELLAGVNDPEQKRLLIGEHFVRIFEREARKLGDPRQLAMGQGTIYPDVIESAAKDRPGAHKIKSHHNVGGLPEHIEFKTIVEPLRWLFKDEVRKVGLELGLPEEIIWRQPFPGPGLGIRILGEITWDGLEKLRKADAILREELVKQDGLRTTAQAFAVLLPVRSVGVMGDARTYEQPVVIRAVETDDFMTADWARLDWDLLAQISRRIVNEVDGINRVVYDITSKPPATIEWE